MFQLLLLLASLSASSSLQCHSCKIEWAQEGFRTYYDLIGTQIKDCPLVTCSEGAPGLACTKVQYTLTTSQWEYRSCSSMFHSECKDVMELDSDACAIKMRCTTDGCNGYEGDATAVSPPARLFPTVSPSDAEEALAMPIILGAAAGGLVTLIILIILVVVLVRIGRRKSNEGYEKAEEGEEEGEKGDNFKMYKDACQEKSTSTRKSIKNFYKSKKPEN